MNRVSTSSGGRRVLPWAISSLGAAFAALQLMAWFHARAFLNYAEKGGREPSERIRHTLGKAGLLLTGVHRPRPQNDRTPADWGLPSETVRFTAPDGTALEAWLIPGAGRPVLLFHGYALARSSLLDEAAAVHALGHPVLLTDFRGSGGSEGNRTTLGYLEALDVAAAVRWMTRRLPRTGAPILYGQSMGGAAVLRAVAELGVPAQGLILESTFDTLLHTVRHRFRALGWPAFPAAESLVFWGGVQSGFNGFRHNPADYAARVTLPALILHGGRDALVSVEDTARLFENLAGPKRQVAFPRAGHASCRPADPDRWRRAVAEFLLVLAADPAKVARPTEGSPP